MKREKKGSGSFKGDDGCTDDEMIGRLSDQEVSGPIQGHPDRSID